ncbi:MAG: metal ABC transporter substrate-binding protein [Bacilli bacterium]|jgi:zinc transport system substrate-binding protein
MKRIIGLFSIGLVFLTSGCFKKDDLEDITIYTSVYPIEYIVDTLYGKNSNVKSIYPDGVDVSKYSLTDKQIKDYSKGNMFIFNGLSDEKDYVTSMFNYNKDLMIIDTTATMEYNNHVEELWLDPSNFLMMSLNVKNGLLEYITNQYLKTEIDNNYSKLKLEISNIDAKIKLMNENSSKKTIVVDNSSFKFLEKYGFEVISLEDNEELTDKTISDVIRMVRKKQITYIFSTDANNLNKNVQKIVKKTGVEILELNDLSNLTENQRNSKEDYISLLNENIDLLKKELYS